MATAPCPICYTTPPRRAFVLPCEHAFCDRCAARFLWDKASCAVCRAAVSSAAPAWDLRGSSAPARYAARMLSVKHRGVVFEVDLDINVHECPYERLGAMFSIPLDRLKIIQKGKLLPARGESDLEDTLRPGVPIQLMGSRTEQQLPPDPSALRRVVQKLHEFVLALFAWLRPADLSARGVLTAALGALTGVVRVCGLFVQSLVLPHPRRDRRRGEDDE
eukprot:7110408-Prymnesium_polylepis.2